MNRYDCLVAVGAFTAGLAAGRYFWSETSVFKDWPALEKEFNKCAAEKRNMSSSAASQRCSLNTATADERSGEEIAEVLFFPDCGYTCDQFISGGCKNENCQFLHQETNLGKICDYVSRAKKSIDVCMYTLGNYQLVSALMQALDRSVTVRLIIDHTTAAGPDIAKQLNRLGPKGALIQEAASNYTVHNKFVIIDDRIIMTGSLNWTNQGILGNYENVVILSHKHLVHQYSEKFVELWHEFADLRVPKHPILDNKDLASRNLLKRSAWDNIIVNYEPPVNNCNSSCTRRPETRRY